MMVAGRELREALDMAHHELVRLGNEANWDPPIDQRTADAINALRWVKGEAEWPPAALAAVGALPTPQEDG